MSTAPPQPDDEAPRHVFKRTIPRNEHGEAADHFAPFSGPHVCHSRAGRWRPAHSYVGGACVFCGSPEGWVPLHQRRRGR